MNKAEHDAAVAKAMTEAALQSQVLVLARTLGWTVWHPRVSIGSTAGWPDLTLAHPGKRRIMFRELKTMRGNLSAAQQRMLQVLTDAGGDVAVWRPHDLVEGRILTELSGTWPEGRWAGGWA